MRARVPSLLLGLLVCLGGAPGGVGIGAAEPAPRTVLIGIGDSLTHGTMDATNNSAGTLNAYLQKVADSLGQRLPLVFSQPLFDDQERRLTPFMVPTNLGVDGADIFSIEGLNYYGRAGLEQSVQSPDLLADRLLLTRQADVYDKVLYPINLLTRQPTSQVDAAVWLLTRGAPAAQIERALVVLWAGNNDSSTAALGAGGSNPTFFPLPVDELMPVMPLVSLVLKQAESDGAVSFAPYTMANIERNLTRTQDFVTQYLRTLARLRFEGGPRVETDIFLLTLPYYSSVGYLFDSDDLEFYLRKANPAYTVPPTFARVASPGEPIVDATAGDRVSLLTFGMMYALLMTGSSVDQANRVLEVDGQQRDGLVLSHSEQRHIRARIDTFNATIRLAALLGGARVHLVDIGTFLNDALTGKVEIVVDGRVLGRQWGRGGGFTTDGVHPGYTAQALVANFVLARLNEVLGLDAPLHDLASVMAADPYIDRDGDGWVSGPATSGPGLAELLFMFRDPDDTDPEAEATLPADVWMRIAQAILREALKAAPLAATLQRLGSPSLP